MVSELNLGYPSSIVKRWWEREMEAHVVRSMRVFILCSSEDAGNEDTFPWIPAQIQEKWRKKEEIVRFWLYIHETLREDFINPSQLFLFPLKDRFFRRSFFKFVCMLYLKSLHACWTSELKIMIRRIFLKCFKD